MNTSGIPMYDPGQDGEKYKFPRRGSFNCNQKDGHDIACPFYIPFLFILKEKCYVISSGKKELCLTHNHASSSIDLDGCEQVKSVYDLTDAEVKSIHTLAITEPGMGQVTQSLAIEYPQRDFDKTLFARLG